MKVLILSNFGMGIYKFRKELLEKLIESKNEIYISFPFDEYSNQIEALDCKFINTEIERRGKNIFSDIKLFFEYIKIIKQINPDIVLTYTIKPNIYGGFASRILNKKYISTITGLGTAVENNNFTQKLVLFLYKIALKKVSCVFFQNASNLKFFQIKNIYNKNYKLVPGSGVNLKEYNFEEYSENENEIKFLFIGRIMKAKGVDEFFSAAKLIKEKYNNIIFEVVGFLEDDYLKKVEEFKNDGIINFYGQQDDVKDFIKNSNALVLPSYHEGLSNVLLEAAAMGRPVIASNISGCKETFEDGVTGIGFETKNVESLKKALIKFIELSYEEKKQMGIKGREKIEKEFDRKIVVDSYIKEINNLKG